MYKITLIAVLALALTACSSTYKKTVNAYNSAAPSVKLGDSKETVIAKLAPSQRRLSSLDTKQPEQFQHDGKLVEILFFRSGWQDDGITTDDEFTPYIFEDNVLTAIGWTVLGGPKTQGQSRPQINVDRTVYPYHHYPRYRY